MSAIDQYIDRIPNKELQEQLRTEITRITQKKKFGLVFENHLPDNITLPEVKIRCGTKVAQRDTKPNDLYEVQSISDDKTSAVCRHLVSLEDKTFNLEDLVAVAQRGDVIYPYLKPMDSVMNAPDSDLWHTLIEADNYHALQLLAYLYPGKVDCIYIDPPYNKPDSHDWKYNCDYVDGSDSYRHSKWLSMIEARLKIAKKLLNPNDSVLIVTIDELEYHHLGCLLEQMFPEASIQMVIDIIHPSGVARENQFARVEEYLYYVFIGSAKPVRSADTMLDFEMTGNYQNKAGGTITWRRMIRAGSNSNRERSENCFYPIFIDTENNNIHSVGFPPGKGVSRELTEVPSGCVPLWPLHSDGSEGVWQIGRQKLLDALDNGTARLGKPNKHGGWAMNYLNEGMLKEIESGAIEVKGRDDNGAMILERASDKLLSAKSVWNKKLHDSTQYGTYFINGFLGGKRFSYPKSLYAVHDTIRFFVANKPNALILDFFAGSGTTMHAVNLLNKEDGGKRRCIMITNNEIGEPKEKELIPQGIRPGDEEWEKWGIARYVNWPRTKCSILGKDVNDNPIAGDYITSLTEIKLTDRKFTQINFLSANANQKQKKALVTLINKQKGIKVPTMTEDVPFIVSEEDDYNASILFDINEAEAWMDALDGNNHITNLFIVTVKDATYKRIKTEVNELMGQIEETVPVTIPMSEGFKTNAAFFKLGFLDKRAVSKGKQLKELLPILWMKAGSVGECPSDISGDYAFFPDNKMAILINESQYPLFKDEMTKYTDIRVVFIITDSQNAYLNMIQDMKGMTTYQLYRDYLENFRINYAVK